MEQLIGTIVDGKFRVLSLLGEGGLGCVFKAEQPDLNRLAAIKVIRAGLGDADDRIRFEREARVLASVSSQHIVSIYSFGVLASGSPYMAIEYLEGVTLTALISTDGLPWSRVVKIGAQICSGIKMAHQAGIVHRDLKPDNIMLLQHPEPDFVKILDFGLSSLLPQSSAQEIQRLTQTGMLLGSIHYMSPEICSGFKADHRADVYALGCILYECLAGRPPLDCDNPIGLLAKHRSELPKPLREFPHLKDLPPQMELVLFKAMQKDPADRFQTMEEFEQALLLIAEGKAADVGLSDVLIKKVPARSEPTIWIATGLAICIVSGAFLYFKVQRKRPDDAVAVRQSEIAQARHLMQAARGASPRTRERFVRRALINLSHSYKGPARTMEFALQDREILMGLADASEGLTCDPRVGQDTLLGIINGNNASFLMQDPGYIWAVTRLIDFHGQHDQATIFLREAMENCVGPGISFDREKADELSLCLDNFLQRPSAKASSRVRYNLQFAKILYYKRIGDLPRAQTFCKEAAASLDPSFPIGSEARYTHLYQLFINQQNVHLENDAQASLRKLEETMAISMQSFGTPNILDRLEEHSLESIWKEKQKQVDDLEAHCDSKELKQQVEQVRQDLTAEADKLFFYRLAGTCYHMVFSRAPGLEVQEKLYARSRLAPLSGADIVFELLLSPEFRPRLANLDTQGKLRVVYQRTLGRNADPGGLTFWTAAAEKQGFPAAVKGILSCDEFTRQLPPLRTK